MPPVVHTEGISLVLLRDKTRVTEASDNRNGQRVLTRQGTAARQCGIEIAARPLAPVVGRKTRKAYREHSARVKADPER